MKQIEYIKNREGKIIRKRVFTVNEEPSKTDPQYAEDCDTNIILRKFMKTGTVTHLAKRQGSYMDVSNVPDLLNSLLIAQEAEKDFRNFPSEVRRRFDNSYTKFVEFINDERNREEAMELGLIPKNTSSGDLDRDGTKSKASGRASKTNKTKNKNERTAINDDDSNDDD
jgi:phage internal scaffolding protein